MYYRNAIPAALRQSQISFHIVHPHAFKNFKLPCQLDVHIHIIILNTHKSTAHTHTHT